MLAAMLAAMMRVAVRIFHPPAPKAALPLAVWLHAARTGLAQHHLAGFEAAGAGDVRVITDAEAGEAAAPFGHRLRALVPALIAQEVHGLVVMGSGALPLAVTADRRRLLAAAADEPGTALANNRYSADVVAIAGLGGLRDVPDAITDNALPRWLQEEAGYRVADMRETPALLVDLDSPLDLALLLGANGPAPSWLPNPGDHIDLVPVRDRIARLRAVGADPDAELLIAGRTSARALGWLEEHTRARVRALVEERGLRTGRPTGRPPASVLGALLDRDGPAALGEILRHLADAAILDTRVLLAHRLGREEAAWPGVEDRFASDLLLADRIQDPWLRALTEAAARAPIPVLLAGHTPVGPGLSLVLGDA